MLPAGLACTLALLAGACSSDNGSSVDPDVGTEQPTTSAGGCPQVAPAPVAAAPGRNEQSPTWAHGPSPKPVEVTLCSYDVEGNLLDATVAADEHNGQAPYAENLYQMLLDQPPATGTDCDLPREGMSWLLVFARNTTREVWQVDATGCRLAVPVDPDDLATAVHGVRARVAGDMLIAELSHYLPSDHSDGTLDHDATDPPIAS